MSPSKKKMDDDDTHFTTPTGGVTGTTEAQIRKARLQIWMGAWDSDTDKFVSPTFNESFLDVNATSSKSDRGIKTTLYLDNEREKCNAESHHLFRSVQIGKLNGVPSAYLSNGSFRTTPIQRIEDSSTLEGFNIGMLLWPPPTYDIDDETNADNARMAQELMGESVEKLADVNINIRK